MSQLKIRNDVAAHWSAVSGAARQLLVEKFGIESAKLFEKQLTGEQDG